MASLVHGGDILGDIVSKKEEEIKFLLASPKPDLSGVSPPLPFAEALAGATKEGRFPVIAEMKRKSPSAGQLRNGNYNPEDLAGQYAGAGAACLSVLTDEEFFGGSNEHLPQARKGAANLPILRKDFIVHERQILESRSLGADAILLIAALGREFRLEELAAQAHDLGMAVIVEIRDEEELARALQIPDALIGINNRNLRNFKVSLEASFTLASKAKKEERFVISESGINSPQDIAQLRSSGADAFLIGTALMSSPDPKKPGESSDPGDALRALFADYSSSAIQP